MTLIITTPEKTINGLLTNVLAVESQARYPIQVVNTNYTSIQDTPPISGFTINVDNDLTTILAPGDRIVLVDDPIYTNQSYLVDSLVAASISVRDSAFLGTSSGILRAIQPNYSIGVDIRDKADTFTVFGKTYHYVPNIDGSINIDISRILTAYIKADFDNFHFEYFARFTEFVGLTGGTPVDTALMMGVTAFKQIGIDGGALMWEFLLRIAASAGSQGYTAIIDSGGFAQVSLDVTGLAVGQQMTIESSDNGNYPIVSGSITAIGATDVTLTIPYNGISVTGTATAAEQTAARILTNFKNPIKWRGWGRTSTVMLDSLASSRFNYNGTQLYFVFRGADINKVGSTLIEQRLVSVTEPQIIIQGIPENDTANDYYTFVEVKDSSSQEFIAEILYYKNENECRNPIMLDWINKDSGIDQWLFSIKQEVVNDVDEGLVVEAPITVDYADVVRTKRRYVGSETQRITMFAEHLTFDQVMALREIKKTESLRVYLNKDGTKFVDAIAVSDFSTPLDTELRNHRYQVTIEFPDDYNFYDAKLY